MSNQIPPLVCSTPPPIDFSDHDNEDDFGGFESADVIYNGFNDQSLPTTPKKLMDEKTKQPNETIDLPAVDALDIPSSPISYRESPPPPSPLPPSKPPINTDVSTDDINVIATAVALNEVRLSNTDSSINTGSLRADNKENAKLHQDSPIAQTEPSNRDSIQTDVIVDNAKTENDVVPFDDDTDYDYRCDSPPSLVLPPETYSDNEASIYGDDVDIDEISVDIPSGEFGNFKTVDFSKFDDNTSLPSLKFDSMDASKSTTPVFSMANDLDDKVFVCDDIVGADVTVPSEQIKIDNCDNEPPQSFFNVDVVTEKEATNSNSFELCDDEDDDDFAEFSSAPAVDTLIVNAADNLHALSQMDEAVDKEETIAADAFEFASEFNSHSESGFNSKSANSTNDLPLDVDMAGSSENVFGSSKLDSHETAPAFVADFSQFESFQPVSDASESNEFAPFESSSSQRKSSLPTPSFDDDDDDGFGEFSDFTQAPQQAIQNDNVNNSDDDFDDFTDFKQSMPMANEATPMSSLPVATDESIKAVLQEMFPETKDVELNSFDKNNFHNGITIKLKDYENSLALNYQWTNSSAKHALIRSLGIDSRNILFGSAWNNSMPRFAANLGFSPLEPMKPSPAGQQSSSSMSNTHATSISKSTSDVPAAQFDWNSSGLVNPLDGVQEILHEAGPSQNQSSRDESNREDTFAASPPKAAALEILSPLPLTTITTTAPPQTTSSNEPIHLDDTPISTSYVVPGSGTLKETHIFTPSKNYTAPTAVTPPEAIAPAVVIPDYDFDQAAAGIIIDEKVVTKEYRDIEYNPEKLRTTSASLNDSDFSEFQSMQMPESNVLEPLPSDKQVVINWPEPGSDVAQSFSIEDHFSSYTSASQNVIEVNKPNVIDSIDQQLEDMSSTKTRHVIPMFTKPIIGVSPSESMFTTLSSEVIANKPPQDDFDDEFTDFQSVTIEQNPKSTFGSSFTPPSMGANNNLMNGLATHTSLNSSSKPPTSQAPPNVAQLIPNQLLQPSLLASQLIDPTTVDMVPEINWPEPGIDPDELARLEAIFPQPKAKPSAESFATSQDSTKRPSKTEHEEDDWSDFVSVTPVQAPNAKTSPAKSQIPKTTAISTPDEDDWTDFVSGTPAPSNAAPWSISKPNFSSWNTPQLPSMQQFNSWHNTNMFLPTQSVPSQGLHHNNNNLPIINGLNQRHQPASPTVSRHVNKAPMIAVIPDLGFMAPNSVLNLSKSGFQKK